MSSHRPYASAGGKTASLLNYRPWPDQLLNLIAFFKIKQKVYTIVSLRYHLLTGKIAETIDNLKNVLPIGTALKQ